MMSVLDDAVGRVLAKVRDIGQEENTLVFFLSDNGGPTEQTTSRNDPLRGRKGTTLEGGVRVPFAAQWKGKIPAGLIYDQPIIQLDILPTAVAAAGGTVDPAWKIDGVDVMAHVTGKQTRRPHEALYWRFGEQWAIRKGNWKLVVNRIDGTKKDAALYNLKDDIGETTDVAAKHPEMKAELLADWKAWNAEQVEALWPQAGARDRH
jgi:arylsulfatase A-like enzyme